MIYNSSIVFSVSEENKMFWKNRGQSGTETGTVAGKATKVKKLPGPKDLHTAVGRDLVVNLGKNPDWVWGLKSVERKRPEAAGLYDVRVFSSIDANKNGVKVKDFTTLDAYPELILFEGWLNKELNETQIVDKKK